MLFRSLAITGLLSLFIPGAWSGLLISTAATLSLIAVVLLVEEDPRTSGKLKLNMTQRARKIALVAFVLFALLAVAPVALLLDCCGGTSRDVAYLALWGILLAQAPAGLLVVANKILWPAEKALQERFYADAKRILREVDPFIIGITGSYGKTDRKSTRLNSSH